MVVMRRQSVKELTHWVVSEFSWEQYVGVHRQVRTIGSEGMCDSAIVAVLVCRPLWLNKYCDSAIGHVTIMVAG